MVLTGLSVVLISLIVFGYETWEAFFKGIPYAMEIIESGEARLYQMPSFMAMSILLAADMLAAKIIHLFFAILALGLTVWIRYKKVPLLIRASSLALGSVLVPIYIHTYDLVILALPIAWIGWESYKMGYWPPGLRYLLVATWVIPLFANIMAKEIKLQLAPPVIFALLTYCYYWANEIQRRSSASGVFPSAII